MLSVCKDKFILAEDLSIKISVIHIRRMEDFHYYGNTDLCLMQEKVDPFYWFGFIFFSNTQQEWQKQKFLQVLHVNVWPCCGA